MLLLLLLWLLVSASALAVGAAVVVACGGAEAKLQAPVLAWVGLAVVATFCSVFTLWLPIGHAYGAALYGCTLLPLAWPAVRRVVAAGFVWPTSGWAAGLALGLVMMGAVFKAAGPTEIFDDAVGYIVIFRAMLDQGIIIGLGNLHPNLAYNSHWSLLGAFYSFEWLLGTAYYDLNGWLAWLGAWYAFSFLPRLWQGQLRGVYVLLALTPFFFFRNQMSGNSTDLPIAILTWMLVAEWLQESKNQSPAIQRLLFVFLPFFALSVKITALAILVLPAAYAWQQYRVAENKTKSWTELGYIAGIGALVLLPWVARNVLMTGYVYYLAPKLDFFTVDWKMPRIVINRLRLQVLFDFHHQPKVLSNPLWWSRWWRWGFNGQQHIMLALTVMSALVGAVGYAWRHSLLGSALWRPRVFSVVLMLTSGLGLWFATATEARYAHAWLVLGSTGLASWALAQVPLPRAKWAGRIMVLAITSLMCLPTYKTILELPPQLEQEVVWPAPYPEVFWRPKQGQNFVAYFPYKYKTALTDRSRFPPVHVAARDSTPNCWCTPLPCVYRLSDLPLLRQRGPHMRDGYRFMQVPKD